jgi:hypothetical protein
MGLLKRAIAAGYGGQDTAAVIKVLRGQSKTQHDGKTNADVHCPGVLIDRTWL